MKRLISDHRWGKVRVINVMVLACLSVAWLVLKVVMQYAWADWLFIPMICVTLLTVIHDFKMRRIKLAISAISSLFIILALIAQRQIIHTDVELSGLRLYLSLAFMGVAIILMIISALLPESGDAPGGRPD